MRFYTGYRGTPEDRFCEKVRPETTGCWEWTGHVDSHGYSRFFDGHWSERGHRFAYRHFIGLIPPRMVIDHLCRNTTCVNPTHLEVVTDRTNILRGYGSPALNARKTHCVQGHPLSGDNLVVSSPQRACRTCHNRISRARHARRRRLGLPR